MQKIGALRQRIFLQNAWPLSFVNAAAGSSPTSSGRTCYWRHAPLVRLLNCGCSDGSTFAKRAVIEPWHHDQLIPEEEANYPTTLRVEFVDSPMKNPNMKMCIEVGRKPA